MEKKPIEKAADLVTCSTSSLLSSTVLSFRQALKRSQIFCCCSFANALLLLISCCCCSAKSCSSLSFVAVDSATAWLCGCVDVWLCVCRGYG